MNKNQEILSLAVLAGEILIKNGGEIFRVEDTMMRIIESYGIKDYNVYVLSNGIFATIDEQGSHPYSLVRHVAFSNVNLERIAAVNQLSREICEFHYPPGEAIQKMKSCSTLLSEKQLLRHLASGFGCAAFFIALEVKTMIVVLKHNVPEEKRNQLINWLRNQNIDVHPSLGEYQTVLGLVGDTSPSP